MTYEERAAYGQKILKEYGLCEREYGKAINRVPEDVTITIALRDALFASRQECLLFFNIEDDKA